MKAKHQLGKELFYYEILKIKCKDKMPPFKKVQSLLEWSLLGVEDLITDGVQNACDVMVKW